MPRPVKPQTPATFAQQIGAEIQRRRLARKLSGAAAAQRAGVPTPTWHHFEQGKIALARLPAIAAALGCKPQALLPKEGVSPEA